MIGVSQIEPERRKRRRRRNKKTNVSDDSTCTSDDSNFSKPRRRRNRTKNKKNFQNKEAELSLEEQSQYMALDCEMVGVGRNGYKSSVARVTLVGWNGEVIFDEFIKQEQEVIDYRTFVSGITEENLNDAELTIEDCRSSVLKIIEGNVLIGHALKNDMKALGITHPWFDTRDTAKYEPFMQIRFDDGVLWPRKLKDLVQQKLNREIQVAGKPHSAYEDALAAMDLYRSVRRKWEKAMDYKIRRTHEIQEKLGFQQTE